MGKTSYRLDERYLAAEEQVKDTVQPPSMYKVILINDDYTPMEFVIDVLQKFFSYDVGRAMQLMLRVHYQGKAVCGIYTAEVAETKAVQVNRYARENEHPLLCTLEKA
ncbi:Clp protease ClpS [Sodalis-like endosymbiont of Proechinophthirus fluctus]|uniref:ATP-dependent Clp protease adapter ClpS n=1 Tax=Sodalis-like endosymbiont of Proechinophthirus fluctus TaxID=1462730 RepID=UPI0007A8954C|nr:ATP-dependent Clp protease adapter ClpS [Sodalis-like endosymbiont of Proechinophthirus fluctus]KYP97169.1 Clp protease ClpS [Sodalis-like endosymbiont of Proechinophthirus fluctus]